MEPKQLRVLADKLENENKIVKVWYLKCDLYDFDAEFHVPYEDFYLLTESRKNELIDDFKNSINLVLNSFISSTT